MTGRRREVRLAVIEIRENSRPSPLYNRFLLHAAQRDRLTVVLVSPRNPLNIGAVARAMANFGFEQLTVVAPYEEHWREAKSAVGAEELLGNAEKTATLQEAVADCSLVVGTGTVGHRRPEQRIASLPQLQPLVERAVEEGSRVALVFGSEKRGLRREDLALCHLLVEIPTDSRQPSMNLGQAVAVCLYELVRPGEASPEMLPSTGAAGDRATSGDLDLLASVVEETMQAAHYSPGIMRDANRHDLQVLLRRLAVGRQDARRILGLFRRILWRINSKENREPARAKK